MSILRLSAVRREVGDFVILDSVSAAVAHGDRIGLVGANGAGKTTLLRLCAGYEEPDGGVVGRKRELSIGLLAQEANLDAALARAPSLRAAVRSGARELEQIEARLHALESAGAAAVESEEYAALRERFEIGGGYDLDVRTEAALSGLGFAASDLERPPNELSGGEQTRAALARLLVADPDLLLLDEPTNHLDISAVEWLETTLAARKRALIVASHDRAFLDAVAGRIWELRDRRLEAFRGNYSAYLMQREERDARLRREHDTQAEAIEREKVLVQRYRSHRKFSKMHEHERRLAALEAATIDVPRDGRRLALPAGGLATAGLAAGGPVRSAETVIRLEDVVCGFPAQPIVRVPLLEARRGDRIGVVGPNGAGKTTLLRTISGELAPLGGYLSLGSKVQLGYLAQVRRAPLAGATVLDAFNAVAGADGVAARSYLARFLFRGDDAFKPVSELSGGERSRLELAILGVMSANLLLLDEPTNHLDIPAREALESFLRRSPATLLVVSHDRRLLETVCSRLWVVESGPGDAPGMVAPFDGGYREWRAALTDGWTADLELGRRQRAIPPAGPSIERAKRPSPVARVPRPQALSKDAYRRRKQVVEEDLTRLGLRKNQLELALASPQVQSNYVDLRRVTSELADVDAALGQAEDAWLSLAERAPR
jgi:ATP-binding cassette, subfamily F, member 3